MNHYQNIPEYQEWKKLDKQATELTNNWKIAVRESSESDSTIPCVKELWYLYTNELWDIAVVAMEKALAAMELARLAMGEDFTTPYAVK